MSCRICHASILPATAERHDGLCVPCSRGERIACRVCGAQCLRSTRGVDLGGICGKCRVEEEKRRPTEIRRFVETVGQGDCSLLVRLFELDERLRRESLDRYIGLNLVDPPRRYETEITPKNSVAFAETGGEDVHFSLVSVKGRVSDASPVVVTVPSTGGTHWEGNFLLGESLHEFLSLGCHSGYSDLEQVAYEWDATITNLEEHAEPEGGLESGETLRIYREELGLRPWANVRERLVALERQKRFVLQFGRDWLRWLRR